MYTNRKKQKPTHTISYIQCRSDRKFNDKDYQTDIDSVDWLKLYVIENVIKAAELFASKILNVVDIHVPFIRFKLWDHGPAWLNYDILSHIDERKYHSRNFNQCPCHEHLVLKIESKIRKDNLKTQVQHTYIIGSLNKCGTNAKKKWQLIREFWPSSKKSTKIEQIGEATDDEGKANTINEFFPNIGKKLAADIPYDDYEPTFIFPPSFDFVAVDFLEVTNIV